MKPLKQWIIPILMLLTLSQSYPQNLLISQKENKRAICIEIVDKVYKFKNKYLDINVTIPQLIGMTNESGQNVVNNSIIIWTEAWIKEVRDIADQYFQDGVPPLNPYQLYSKYYVTKIGAVISFYVDYYQYTGGAHGITIRKAYSVDNLSGKNLELKDLFKVDYDYKTKLNNEIKNQIDKDPDKYFSGKDGFKGVDDNTKFYVKDDKLIIYYDQYEIAPYVAGIPEFYINQSMFEGNFIY